MKTTTEHKEFKVHVWAIPKYEYELKSPDYNGVPFNYHVHNEGYSPWQTGAVNVYSTTINIVIPEGINLIEKAVDTLSTKILERTKAFHNEIAEIQKQIDALLFLEAPKEEEEEEEVKEEEKDGNPWIYFPVDEAPAINSYVDMLFANGTVIENVLVGTPYWITCHAGNDLMAYRIHK